MEYFLPLLWSTKLCIVVEVEKPSIDAVDRPVFELEQSYEANKKASPEFESCGQLDRKRHHMRRSVNRLDGLRCN